MANDALSLYKKISSLSDLRDAISMVKKTMKSSNKPKQQVLAKDADMPNKEETPKEHPLKYLGRKKIIGGILSHLIGTGNEGDNSYQVDCHLEKHNKGLPSIIISHVSPKGEILDHSPDFHQDMKDAIRAIVNHKMKKAWK